MIECTHQTEVDVSEGFLPALRTERIFYIESCDPRGENFLLTEACDDHYTVVLSAEELRAIAEEIADKAGGGWQPWDTAPTDGTHFDAWVEPNRKGRKGFRAPDVHFDLDAFWTTDTEYLYELGTPTHWRREPEGPKK